MITVTDVGVSAALRAMMAQLSDLTPIYKAIGSKLERNVNLRFDTKTDPAGKAWAAWAPSTAAARKQEGRGTLLEYTGRMRDSLTFLADGTGVEVGFGVDYAKFHEQLTPGEGHLPQRAMLALNGELSQGDLDDALSAAMTALRKNLKAMGIT